MALTATLHAADLTLAIDVAAADRVHASRTSLFLELRDDDDVGWGECATSMAPGVDASLDEVVGALHDRVLDVAFTRRGSRVDGATPALAVASQVSSTPADLAAGGLIDAALLDLRLRREGRSLATELGVASTSVGFAGVVGIDEPGPARQRAAQLVAAGATRLRVKVSPASGTACVEAVLDEVPVPVVADGNGAFHPVDDERALWALLGLPLAWLEQPFAAGNLASHAALAARSDVPLCLDESIRSVRNVRDAARYGAASVICCKPGRVGGVARAREIRREARRLGLASYVGGYFEAGLGRAVLGALAAELDDGLDGDVVAPSSYLVSDPCALAPPAHGRQPLHLAAGCGPEPDPAALRVLHRRHFAR